MTAAEAAGWIGSFIALGGYALSVRRERPRIFHIANVVGSIGVGVSAFAVGAWPNLFLTACFGLIGAWGLLQGESDAR
jgi:hypothetical protein